MGWGDCGFDDQGRPIGYSISATCDEPDCHAEIDRGLAYVCGGMHGGGEHGCGRYFCASHLYCGGGVGQLCKACSDALPDEDEDDE